MKDMKRYGIYIPSSDLFIAMVGKPKSPWRKDAAWWPTYAQALDALKAIGYIDCSKADSVNNAYVCRVD